MKSIAGVFAFATLLLAGCAMQDQGDARAPISLKLRRFYIFGTRGIDKFRWA